MIDYISYLISNNTTLEERLESNIGVIGTIAGFWHIRQFVKYNGKLDQFEIPVSKLEENNLKVRNEKFVYTIGKRSEILCYVDEQNNFCFGIKTDW